MSTWHLIYLLALTLTLRERHTLAYRWRLWVFISVQVVLQLMKRVVMYVLRANLWAID